MSGIILKAGATGVDLSVDEAALLAEVERVGTFFSTSVLHNKALRRLAERCLIDLKAPADLHKTHIANAKAAARTGG